MASNVIGLFSSEEVAQRVMDELRAQGFNRRNINHLKGDQGDLEDELEREGVSAADANYYAGELRQGGALVSVRAEDNHVDEAVAIMNRHAETEDDFRDDADYAAPLAGAETDAVDSEVVGADTLATDEITGGSRTVEPETDEAHLNVVEERLRVGKREVQRGGMRVRRVVSERPVEEQVVLRDETVRVDRRPVDRTLDAADGDLFTEQTFEFTETDEEAVIAKEAHVIEEVVVGKDVETRTETVRDTVRRADVEIEKMSQSYGQNLAGDVRYEGREWHDFESEARADYERDNQGGKPWDEVRDSVRSSWEEKRQGR